MPERRVRKKPLHKGRGRERKGKKEPEQRSTVVMEMEIVPGPSSRLALDVLLQSRQG